MIHYNTRYHNRLHLLNHAFTFSHDLLEVNAQTAIIRFAASA